MTHSNLKPMYSFDELPEGVECFGRCANGKLGSFIYKKSGDNLVGSDGASGGWSDRGWVIYKDWTFFPIPIPNPEDEWAECLDDEGDFDFACGHIIHPKNTFGGDVKRMRKRAPLAIKFIQHHYIDGDDK